MPTVTIAALSDVRGAAVALREFVKLGHDITAPFAHVDIVGSDGVEHTMLVEEVLDWLNDPKHASYVHHECLDALLR